MKELEEKFKNLINTAREERRNISDLNRKTELQGYIKGLEEALKTVKENKS